MSGNVYRDVAEVKTYLATQYMNVDEEWLAGCVEYLYNDGSGKHYSIDEIKMLTRGQWLLNDLTVICPGSLPPGLNQTPRTVLNGKFVLQINYLMDIGCPAYQQLQKLNKINEENIEATVHREDKTASHRMVRMDLTDGVQDIIAIEYRPMRNLTCELPPGTKILLKGPVDCSIGTLLLEEKNVEVLGGEVDSLVEANTTLKILNRLVYGQTEGPISNSSVQNGPPGLTNPRHNFQREVPKTNINCNSRTNTATSNINNQRTIARPSKHQATIDSGRTRSEVDNFKEDDMNIDIDELAALEQEALASASISNRKVPTQAKHTIQFRSPDSYDNISNAPKKIKIDANSLSDNMKPNYMNDYTIDDMNPTDDEDLEVQILSEMDAKLAQPTTIMHVSLCDKRGNNTNSVKPIHPIQVPAPPFHYIKQINDILENNRGDGRKFIIKAQIRKLLSKIVIIKNVWTLRCTLIDGSGKLDADFTSDTLTKLIGYSPTEMGKMKKLFEANPDLKLKAMMALKSAREKLQILNCLVEITITDAPKITQLAQYTDEHLLSLKLRSTANHL